MDSEPGPDGRPRRKFETRIWDRTTAEQAGDVPRAVAIGPGPTKTSMVLCSLDDRSVSVLMVHDLPAGKLWKVAGGPVCPISMQGKHLLYVKPSADGKETLYLARIELPRSP